MRFPDCGSSRPPISFAKVDLPLPFAPKRPIRSSSESDKVRLKNSVTFVDWSPFIANDSKTIGTTIDSGTDDIEFADDKTQEYKSLIEEHVKSGKSNIVIHNEDDTEINVDDI